MTTTTTSVCFILSGVKDKQKQQQQILSIMMMSSTRYIHTQLYDVEIESNLFSIPFHFHDLSVWPVCLSISYIYWSICLFERNLLFLFFFIFYVQRMPNTHTHVMSIVDIFIFRCWNKWKCKTKKKMQMIRWWWNVIWIRVLFSFLFTTQKSY